MKRVKLSFGGRFLALALALALAGTGPVGAIAPERSLMPEPRPQGAAAEPATPPPTMSAARAPEAMLAPQRSAFPRARSISRARSAARAPAAGSGLCGRASLEGRSIAPIRSSTQGCGIAEPVRISAVDGIRLSRPATLDCDTARALDTWVRESMRPAMGNRGGGVTRIEVAAHYICRTRNNRPGARVSEHGRGRAIDISGFRLANGESITILNDYQSGRYANALQRLHREACGTFTTTLGPGSDGFHEDHLHFDLAQRRSGATFCR